MLSIKCYRNRSVQLTCQQCKRYRECKPSTPFKSIIKNVASGVMNPSSGWWLPVTNARDVSTKALFGTRLWRLQTRMLHHVPDESVYIHNMPSTTRSSKSDNPSLTVPQPPLEAPALEDKELCFSYEIARGEMGVLSFEPYKSLILPYWAFRTVPIAQNSAEVLWEIFRSYVERGDLVGADMTRKFIQMGMTRAKRYANHKGGRKYGSDGKVLDKWSGDDKDGKRREKQEASDLFKSYWRRCTEDEAYIALKAEWQKQKKEYRKS